MPKHERTTQPPHPPHFRGADADPGESATPPAAPKPAAHTPGSTINTTPIPREIGDGRRWLALIAMLFAVSMTFIDQTIVAIASNTIGAKLELSHDAVQWGVNSYLLALAATFALGGRLADVIGSKRMVILGVVVFAGSSALCGATPFTGSSAEAWLIGFRALQGVGGALMIPAALAVVIASFPLQERGKAVAIFFGVAGGLTAIGPIAGGYLTQWTWRAVFWVNVPMAIIALVIAARARIDAPGRHERIDLRGALLIAAGMVLSVLGLEQGGTWGWTSLRTIGVLAAGAAVLVVFVVVELRTEQPLLQLRIFRGRAFVVDNLVLFFSNIAFVPVFFFASLYAQNALGYGAQHTGVYLVIFFAGFAPGSQIGGRLLDKIGARLPMTVGAALSTFGFAFWAYRITDLNIGAQALAIFLSGGGIGLLLGQASTDAVNRAFNASYGEVSGISQTVRNYAAALGIAVLGTIFSSRLSDHLPSGGSVSKTALAHAFAHGTRGVLIGMAVALGLCFLAALLHPGGKVAAAEITGAARSDDRPAVRVGERT